MFALELWSLRPNLPPIERRGYSMPSFMQEDVSVFSQSVKSMTASEKQS